MSECACPASTAVCGCISRGTGELNYLGGWENPCAHGNEYTPYDHDCSLHGALLSSKVPYNGPFIGSPLYHKLLDYRVAEIILVTVAAASYLIYKFHPVFIH